MVSVQCLPFSDYHFLSLWTALYWSYCLSLFLPFFMSSLLKSIITIPSCLHHSWPLLFQTCLAKHSPHQICLSIYQHLYLSDECGWRTKRITILTGLILNSWPWTSTGSLKLPGITPYFPARFHSPDYFIATFLSRLSVSLPIWHNLKRFPHPPTPSSASLPPTAPIHLAFLAGAASELCFGLKSAFPHVDMIPSLLLTQGCTPRNLPSCSSLSFF